MNVKKYLEEITLDYIKPKHRVEKIGTYNYSVIKCVSCGMPLDILGRDCIGFGLAMKINIIENPYAVVTECPACVKRQWSHAGKSTYRKYLRYLNKEKDNEL